MSPLYIVCCNSLSCLRVPESVPDLTHLCRLAVRASVGSAALSKPAFVRQLPVPTLLQDYIQFNDISSAYTFTASANRDSAN